MKLFPRYHRFPVSPEPDCQRRIGLARVTMRPRVEAALRLRFVCTNLQSKTTASANLPIFKKNTGLPASGTELLGHCNHLLGAILQLFHLKEAIYAHVRRPGTEAYHRSTKS